MVPRGLKRRAEDNLEKDRLTKRFRQLSLGGSRFIDEEDEYQSKWCLCTEPPKPPSSERLRARNDVGNNIPREDSVAPMQVDETRDRVYIADLDAELSSDDASDDKIIFLPEVEKRLTKVPESLLASRNPPPNTHTELVLYTVPSSLSVPVEQDNVRKAIIETRARVREEQQREQRLAREQEADARMVRAASESEYALLKPMEVDERQAMQELEELETMRDIEEIEDPDAMDIG